MSNVKQVIIIRKDLNMRKGKMIAQGAHASMAVLTNLVTKISDGDFSGEGCEVELYITDEMKIWLENLATKICVYVNSEAELLAIYNKAKDANIPCSLIKDAGLTEFKEPTYTAVAIGPATSEEVDKFTGALPLL